jgi:hypothetical protein
MPSVRKTNPPVDRKTGKRKPVGKLQQPQLPMPSIRANAGRRNRAAGPPAAATGAGLIIEETDTDPATETASEEVGRPADRLISPETIAAAAALDSPGGQAANGAASVGAEKDAHHASAPPPGELTVEQCTADAAELIEFAWSSIEAAGIALPTRTRATLEKKETRASIAAATGRLFHHYGLAGTDIIANPWAGLALALSPVAIAGFMDWRELKAKADATAKSAPPTPSAVDSTVASPMAPPSNLTSKL